MKSKPKSGLDLETDQQSSTIRPYPPASIQISFENDRLHNPHSEAQDLLPSLRPKAAANLKAALIQAAHEVGEL
jgi:hypothetical protein